MQEPKYHDAEVYTAVLRGLKVDRWYFKKTNNTLPTV
jgi:hypothetical protein